MRVLVADDEKGLRESIAEYLELEDIEVDVAENGLSAIRQLEDEDFDTVILDLKMPGADGLEVLKWMKENTPGIPVLMISAFGEVSDAVAAIKLGAEDYLVKPFETEELLLKIRKAGEKRKLQKEVEYLRSTGAVKFNLKSGSPAMKPVMELVHKAAPSPANILITGESGTGKEVFARYIHSLSSRSSQQFVAVNVGGVPESLLESELFGYEKGAFTGADRMKSGLFETASGGTLFLDEIGDMPLHLQVKLLRAIQERKIQRLGAVRQINLDVRIIAATNRDLEKSVKDGLFREDLFYRLNVVRVHLPPLRERKEDIPVLCAGFLENINQKMGRSIEGLTSGAIELLNSYGFPGNIRELENMLERAVILAAGTELTPEDFSISSSPARRKAQGTLKDIERLAIIDSLARWEGRKTRVAEELGIDRKTLFNKIKEYGLE